MAGCKSAVSCHDRGFPGEVRVNRFYASPTPSSSATLPIQSRPSDFVLQTFRVRVRTNTPAPRAMT